MKTILITFVTCFGIWAGAQSLQPNSGTTQIGGANGEFLFTPIPLTNQPAFTNTLVPPTNGHAFEQINVVKLLLSLQTNIETTLPVLDFIQSNANVVSIFPTNIVHGFAAPMTSIPPPLGLTPTGAASGTNRPQVTSLSVRIGTNNFDIDAATLQGIFILRNGLQQTLPVLQSLNGTSPSQANAIATPPSTFNPGVTNFMPNPITNQFTTPLTNNIAPF
jgi:hypothetical protein